MTPPTRYALVEREPSAEIIAKAIRDSGGQIVAEDVTSAWSAMLAAIPNGGAVTAADLERAAEAAWKANNPIRGCEWPDLLERVKRGYRNVARAALTAIGLPVADAREEAGNG